MAGNLEEELKRLREERQKKFDEQDWEAALEIHDEILKLSPSALRYANRGSILFRLGRTEEAIKSYKDALELDPSLKRARSDLERLEAQLAKELQEKKEQLGEEPSEDEKQKMISDFRNKRQECLEKQDWETALEYHNKILNLEPSALRYANQGSILYRMNRLHEAAESYRKALEIDPSMDKAQSDLQKLEAQIEEESIFKVKGNDVYDDDDISRKIDDLRQQRQEKLKQEDFIGALEIHKEIIKVEPTALRYANQGALFYRIGDFDNAKESYKKALEMDPELTKAKEDLLKLEAQMEEEVLLTAVPVDEEYESNLSFEEKSELINKFRDERQHFLDNREWEKALEAHDKILELEPTALRYVNRGSMLFKMKKIDEAIESYKKALEMDPSLGRAKKDLEKLEEFRAKKLEGKPSREYIDKKIEELKVERQNKINEEKWEEALELQNQILELEPTALRYINKASILYRLSKIDDAIIVYRKALDLDPDCERAKQDLKNLKDSELNRLRKERQVKMEAEDWEGALKIHDAILALEPSALRYSNRGSILFRMKRIPEAIESCKKALELDPNLEKAKEDLAKLEEELENLTPLVAIPTEFEEEASEEEEFFEAVEVIEADVEEEHVEEEQLVEEKELVEADISAATISGHTDEITDMCATSDGNLLISASKDKKIKIWDLNTKKCLRTLEGHTDWVRKICITKDNAQIISASDDWNIRIWNINTGKCEQVLKGHTMPVLDVKVSHNKRFIFSCSRDKKIKVWDFKSAKCISTLDVHKDWVNCLNLTPDGNKFISGSYDKTIKIWNILGWRCTASLEEHENWIEKIILTDDFKNIISSSKDKTIKIWSISNGNCLNTLEGHTNAITDMIISENILISSDRDNNIFIWDLDSGEQKSLLKSSSRILKLISNNNLLLSAGEDSKISVWKLENNFLAKEIEEHKKPVTCLINVGDKVISGSKDNTIKIWDTTKLI